MTTPAISLQRINKRFGKKTAVRDLDLEVPQGSIYGLIGPNGAGKTTSIRIMLDIIGPDSGSVAVFGSKNIEAERGRIGYLPEERGLYAKMTVIEHLVFFGELRGMKRRVAREEALKGLEQIGLAERMNDKVESLSKGMAQKIQFLATILHKPELLVLDEPFSGLDPLNVDLFKGMVLERQRQGATLLFSTHLIEDAERLCEYVCMIAGASKVLDGRIADVKGAAGRNEIAISYEGDGAFLEAPGLVDRVADHGQYVEVRLREGADPQELLRRAVNGGTRLSRFELVEPSLREIFIDKATEAGLSPEDASEDQEVAA
ncbi:MAG: ATP-binding cassette domain-containing protein [Gemmatimonadota bacterium]|nr:ATP-binding cassette domain-containing protein [Gemmatimonadota bacterium]